MRFAKPWGDPDDGLCGETGETGHDLPKMDVIPELQLVLDQDQAVILGIAG